MKILEEIVKADEQRLCQVYVLSRYDDSEGEGSQYEDTYGRKRTDDDGLGVVA